MDAQEELRNFQNPLSRRSVRAKTPTLTDEEALNQGPPLQLTDAKKNNYDTRSG
jgi:hypothetical protein